MTQYTECFPFFTERDEPDEPDSAENPRRERTRTEGDDTCGTLGLKQVEDDESVWFERCLLFVAGHKSVAVSSAIFRHTPRGRSLC